MGYYDDRKEEVDINVNVYGSGPQTSSSSSSSSTYSRSYHPNTITVPCHHIHIGDLLLIQGRPCQIIKITMSPATSQYRYLGIGLFDRQMYEETSFVSNPSPSVYVQNMLAPVFKQYRVLDVVSGEKTVVAMTEEGKVVQQLRVLEKEGLWSRLASAWAGGSGSVRVLVVRDAGREVVVDVKVLGGAARL